MLRLFNHHVPAALLLLGLIEVALLFNAAELAWQVRAAQIDSGMSRFGSRLPQLLVFAAVVWTSMLAVGVYHNQSYRSLRVSATRMVVAVAAAILVLAALFYFVPGVSLWRSISLYALLFGFVLVLAGRYVFLRVVGLDNFRRRVMVLGAGMRASRVATLAQQTGASFETVCFVRMTEAEPQVECAIARADLPSMSEVATRERIDEVVVAIEERRGALPMADLLQVRIAGVPVTDISTFIERETGRVDLEFTRPSWLIFSDGFLGGKRLTAVGKRLFDVSVSVLLLILTSPLQLLAAVAVKATSRGPVFYTQERVGQFGRTFRVVKFRSMTVDAEKHGPQFASKNDARVTPVGRFIRLTRIDEIPQIYCVLKGEMSFIGPRPERPVFVSQLAAEIPYYNERHVVKPGITGWAQINYPYGATVEDARAKLEYDLYYIKNYSLFLDILILIQTVRVVLWQDGSR